MSDVLPSVAVEGSRYLEPRRLGMDGEGWKIITHKDRCSMCPPRSSWDNQVQCKAGCATLKCICKKHGLEYTSVCGECKVVSCEKAQRTDLNDELNDDQE